MTITATIGVNTKTISTINENFLYSMQGSSFVLEKKTLINLSLLNWLKVTIWNSITYVEQCVENKAQYVALFELLVHQNLIWTLHSTEYQLQHILQSIYVRVEYVGTEKFTNPMHSIRMCHQINKPILPLKLAIL